MSAVLSPAAAPAPAGVPALKVTQGRVLLSEFTKFRSLRSTVWTLLAAVVLMIGIGALFSAVTASQYHTFSAADRASMRMLRPAGYPANRGAARWVSDALVTLLAGADVRRG